VAILELKAGHMCYILDIYYPLSNVSYDDGEHCYVLLCGDSG